MPTFADRGFRVVSAANSNRCAVKTDDLLGVVVNTVVLATKNRCAGEDHQHSRSQELRAQNLVVIVRHLEKSVKCERVASRQ
jgi:hypothetical protein